MLAIAGMKSGTICDVGAGVAHLTLMLDARGFQVVAVEPNDAMRKNGIERTARFQNVRWHEGKGKRSGQGEHAFDMVTFGSSFNVCDRQAALRETARILKPRGWFACMWNHRKLDDPIQVAIEQVIAAAIPGYGYGTRREDQTKIIQESNLFGPVVHLDAEMEHEQSIAECVEAWRTHVTLERQAGDKFGAIVTEIERYLNSLGVSAIHIPPVSGRGNALPDPEWPKNPCCLSRRRVRLPHCKEKCRRASSYRWRISASLNGAAGRMRCARNW